MNNYQLCFFKLKKALYSHIFGLCSRLRIPYSALRISYYHFIMHNLSPILKETFNSIEENGRDENIPINHNDNRYVWVMWWQGIENAPKVVQSNIENMKQIFGERLKIITEKNVADYIMVNPMLREKFRKQIIKPATWSDIIRVNLLSKYGGLWVDSTVVLSRKILDLPELFSGSFVSICSKQNKSINVSYENWTTWFIGGEAQEPIFNFLSLFFINYFKKFDFNLDYFLIDYAICFFYNKNLRLQQQIEKQKLDWHALYFYDNLYTPLSKVDYKKFENQLEYSVQKVTYRIDEKKLTSNSLYNYIVKDN